MKTKVLDGKKLALQAEIEIKNQVDELLSKGITPTLATILVGDDPASETYVRMKRNTCSRVGIKSIAVELPKNTSTDELLSKIVALNKDSSVNGILLQHPVPKQIDERKCFDAIAIASKHFLSSICLGTGCCKSIPLTDESLFKASILLSNSSVDVFFGSFRKTHPLMNC